MSARPDLAKATLGVVAAFLAGYAARLASALLLGVAASAAPAAVAPAATAVPELAAAAPERAAAVAAPRPRVRSPQAAAERPAVPAPDVAPPEAAPPDAAPPAPAALVDRIAVLPLGRTSASVEAPPLLEDFDVAAARCSSRNAARPTALADAPFRFLAYRSADGFETTCGDLARRYSASPDTWMGILAADNGRSLSPAGETPPFDPARLGAAQCASLRAAVLDYVHDDAEFRRRLFGALAAGAAAAGPPALDPRTTSAVFAGERGVAVVARGADAELDRLLDELDRAESAARSDVEFILQ